MAAKFMIKKAKDGYRFVLKASNGETVATSESYSNAAGARRGAEACRRAAATAEIVDEVASSKEEAEKLAKQ